MAAGGHVEMPPANTAPHPIARAEQPVAPRRDEPTRDEPTRADAPAIAAAPRPKMTTFTFQPLEEAAEPAAIADSAQSAAAAGSTRRAVPARSFFPQPRPIGRDQ